MCPGVVRAKQTAAKPEQIDPLVVYRKCAEKRSVVGGRELVPAPPVIVRAIYPAGFRGDVESAGRGRGDLIQMKVIVVDSARQPGVATVAGLQKVPVSTDGNAVIGVFEPDVQQRALLLWSRKHGFPRASTVPRAQDNRVVANCPAAGEIVEAHSGERYSGRYQGPEGIITIRAAQDGLDVSIPGRGTLSFRPSDERTFFLEGQPVRLEFVTRTGQEVRRAMLVAGGEVIDLVKTKQQ